MNQEKLKKTISRHKRMIPRLVEQIDNNVDIKDILNTRCIIQRTSREICLVIADFKCQKCGSEQNLQYHHLITKLIKQYVNLSRYESCRYYFSNIIVLCKDCHAVLHDFKGDAPNRKVLPEKFIDKIKDKYEYDN